MNKLILICLLCLYPLLGMSQETKVYVERTVYYKMDDTGELQYAKTEEWVKELTIFEYNKTFIKVNFYIGEFRFDYTFNYEYTDLELDPDEPTEFWKNDVQNAILIMTSNKITINSFRDHFAIVYHLDN